MYNIFRTILFLNVIQSNGRETSSHIHPRAVEEISEENNSFKRIISFEVEDVTRRWMCRDWICRDEIHHDISNHDTTYLMTSSW